MCYAVDFTVGTMGVSSHRKGTFSLLPEGPTTKISTVSRTLPLHSPLTSTMRCGRASNISHGTSNATWISTWALRGLRSSAAEPFSWIGNDHNVSCVFPAFWHDDGTTVPVHAGSCRALEFDQDGDMEAFSVHPDWNRQLSKFASV